MHQIAPVAVDVKYRLPGNRISYVSITFEIYKDGIDFFVVPVTCEKNMRLTNLPTEFAFRFDNKVFGISLNGLEEIVDEIVGKLQVLGLIKIPREYSKNTNFDYSDKY